MKKLISVLLAVSTLALSTSVFAAPAVTDRNPAAETLAEASTDTLPCFRNGDTVTFDLAGLTGAQLTLISSKVGQTADNSTIQYINQYTVAEGAATVTYKIRALTDGLYNILIKDGDAAVVDYFYTVANPTVAPAKATADGVDYLVAWNEATQIAGFAAFASVEGANFTESGVKSVGFTFNEKAVAETLSAEELDAMIGEVSGKVNVVYGIQMTDVEDVNAIEPSAVMN